ncbi:MAG: hypothetical protein JW828_05285 [Sedimentisphaerales bacterium]|nr:hypothetical protein [Sedimentisphaerales bacterium]
MVENRQIITVGISPSWDIRCYVDDLAWGQHKTLSQQTVFPAGKALNVSRALGWLGRSSMAAGLWGQTDYQELVESTIELQKKVTFHLTVVPGRTRQNITVIDRGNNQEIHLRAPHSLSTKDALRRLAQDLRQRTDDHSICVFSGAMPEGELLEASLECLHVCRDNGAMLVIDTYGPALSQILRQENPWLIKPNLQEWRGLVNFEVQDEPEAIDAAARQAFDGLETVIVSRGQKGAVAVTRQHAWSARPTDTERPTISTVGCGDFLLAGFLDAVLSGKTMQEALKQGVKVGSAHALGLTEAKSWSEIADTIGVELQQIR